MSERLKIHLAYQRGWQVVDGSAIVDTFDTKEAAFQLLVDGGARVHLDWARTVICGQAAAYDFKDGRHSSRKARCI